MKRRKPKPRYTARFRNANKAFERARDSNLPARKRLIAELDAVARAWDVPVRFQGAVDIRHFKSMLEAVRSLLRSTHA